MRGLSLVAASGGHSSSRCAGLSLSWPLLLRSTGSRCAGSVVVAHGPSCSAACGISPDQGSNPCRLHRQADSQPLRHQGSPRNWFFKILFCVHVELLGFWAEQRKILLVLEVKERSLTPLFGQLEPSLLNLLEEKGCQLPAPGNLAFPPAPRLRKVWGEPSVWGL